VKIASQQSQLHSSRRGFSLAEVLFALAITSFALLALIGVLPEGLRSLQNAQRQEAEARITQHIAARYQVKTWDELNESTPQQQDLNFDGNGAPLEQSSSESVYRARAEVMDAAPLPNESAASPYLRRLRIRITNNMGNAGALDNPAQHRERWVTLVDLDKTPPPPVVAEPVNPTGTTTNGSTGATANP
jgi:uncharacterized protein (TIGR02598 family)